MRNVYGRKEKMKEIEANLPIKISRKSPTGPTGSQGTTTIFDKKGLPQLPMTRFSHPRDFKITRLDQKCQKNKPISKGIGANKKAMMFAVIVFSKIQHTLADTTTSKTSSASNANDTSDSSSSWTTFVSILITGGVILTIGVLYCAHLYKNHLNRRERVAPSSRNNNALDRSYSSILRNSVSFSLENSCPVLPPDYVLDPPPYDYLPPSYEEATRNGEIVTVSDLGDA